MLIDYFASTAWLSAGGGVASDVTISVTDGTISAITTERPAPPDAVVLPGLVIPGLVNAHSHAFHRALRGRTQAGRGDFWSWRQQMYRVVDRMTPDDYYRLARAVYGEMVLSGITTVCEFHYLHHDRGGAAYADPAAMGHALSRAAAEAGIDLVLLDTCYLQADVDGTALSGPQLRFGDRDAAAWAARADQVAAALSASVTPPRAVGAAIHSVRACSPEAMRTVADWALTRDVPLHLHLSEQRRENDACQSHFGLTPTALCADNGVLGPQTTAVHATHMSDADIALLGESGTVACICPTTERDLADGIGPAAAMRHAGSPLSLGSDSHAVVDLFEEARGVELNERLATMVRGHHTADSLLSAATAGGAASAGTGPGALVVGGDASFIALDGDSTRLAGTTGSQLSAGVVFAAGAADVTHVVRRGELVVSEGRHRHIADVGREMRESVATLFDG